ncbi:MAG: alpha/beta hydrolase [Actinobacteria bacterium]|nr:alpha/beta hydrolase [Actinomycetota bacterium]
MSPLHLREAGSGPVLLLLHAFPCDGQMWQAQAEAIAAAGWRVVVPDLPGFGVSPLPDDEPDIDVVADAVIDLLASIDTDRCVVGGVSLGGYVAMAITRRRPDLVAGLILCDTKATADADAARENRERLAALCLASPGETARILEQAVLPGLLGETTRLRRPAVVDRVRAWLTDADAASVAWYQRAMAGRPDSLATLRAAGAPTLVVYGDEDTLSPRAEQELMVAVNPDTQLVVIPAAGHLALVEDPAAVTDAMLRFLQRVTDRQTS